MIQERKERHQVISVRWLVTNAVHWTHCSALTYPGKCSRGEKLMLWWVGHPERSGPGKTSPHKTRCLGPTQWHRRASPAPKPADQQRQETQWNNWFLFSCEEKGIGKVVGEGCEEEGGESEGRIGKSRRKEWREVERERKKHHTLNIIHETQFSLLHHGRFSVLWPFLTSPDPCHAQSPLCLLPFCPDQRLDVGVSRTILRFHTVVLSPTYSSCHPTFGPSLGTPSVKLYHSQLLRWPLLFLLSVTPGKFCIVFSLPLYWVRVCLAWKQDTSASPFLLWLDAT